jgi:hypothetical protein
LDLKIIWSSALFIPNHCLTTACFTYRITAGLKVETDIITSIAENIMEQAVILVIMYVETYKFLTSHCQTLFSFAVSLLTLAISLREIEGKMSKLPIK